MKREIGLKLIEALRSGKYIQGDGVLYNASANKYCCLGVLCEIAGANWDTHLTTKRMPVNNEVVTVDVIIGVPYINAERYSRVEDEMIEDEIALREFNLKSKEQDTLAEMNDSGEHDFDSIANYIEANLLEAA